MGAKSTLSFLILLVLTMVSFAQTSTVFSGNWSSISNWDNGVPTTSENATVQHEMILDMNLSIGNHRNFKVYENGSITDPAGGGNFDIQVSNNGMLDVDANIKSDGNFKSGGLRVRAYDTLIVGNTTWSGDNITIDSFGVVIINGDLDINDGGGFYSSVTINCDGTLFVNGDVDANGALLSFNSVNGTGKFQATGYVDIGWGSSIFGSNNVSCSPGCEFGGGSGLPIELLSFNAIRTNEGVVKIEWITETELNNDFFIVEKSFDGYIFEKIAKVPGAGNSLSRKYYEISTTSDPKDVYFRLTQVDFDGSSRSYTPIALEASQIFENSASLIYPNPIRANSSLNVHINNPELNTYLEIRDISGKLLFEQQLNSQLSQIHLDGRFKNGIYLLFLINSNEIVTTKLIVGN